MTSRTLELDRYATPRLLPVRAALAVIVALAAVVGVGAASGGFFPTSFGWTSLAFAWLAAVTVVAAAPAWGTLDVIWAVTGTAFVCVALVSATWAGSAPGAVDGGLRALVYATGVGGVLALVRRGDLERWLAALVGGASAICFYALATRLFPGHFGAFNADSGYRLFVPIGYWNGLGIFAVIATLLAVGVAVLGRRPELRVIGGLAPAVLLPTLYYTFSRGSWAALFAGLVVGLAYSRRRERLFVGLLLLGALPALGVWLASRPAALTDRFTPLSDASHAGHRLALELALVAVAQAAVVAAYVFAGDRIAVPRGGVAALRLAVAIGLVVTLVAAIAHYGSPTHIAHRAYHSFTAPPTGGTNLNGRLFTFSSNGRTVLWRSAWNEFRAHPVVGDGAGSFQRWWYAHRTSGYQVQDAHNLYVQTLGELGIVGAVALALFLGVPLVAAVRARREPLAAAALAAYVAFLVHNIVDWDWQLPAVTLLALFAGAALVVAARRDPRPLGIPARAVVGGLAGVAAVIAFVGLIGNIALAKAEDAVASQNGGTAVAQAEKAHRWAPWSAEALRTLGEGEILAGDRAAGLADLRRAAAKDPGDWETWFDVASASSGAERARAVARVRALNPHGPELALLEKPPRTK